MFSQSCRSAIRAVETSCRASTWTRVCDDRPHHTYLPFLADKPAGLLSLATPHPTAFPTGLETLSVYNVWLGTQVSVLR